MRKAKKRGVKPGTKRGRYKKPLKFITDLDSLKIDAPEPAVNNSLSTQLERSIDRMEERMKSYIDRIEGILA